MATVSALITNGTARRVAYAALMIALFAVGVNLRARHLGDDVRYDEAFTYIEYAKNPYAYLLTTYGEPNNQFLNTIAVKASAAAFGPAPAAWRLPNFLAGLAVMAFVALLANKWHGRTAAAFALAASALNAPLAHYAVLARGYGLSVAAALGAFYLLDRWPPRDRPVAVVIGVAALAAASCYAVPTAAIFATALFAYDGVAAVRGRGVGRWLWSWLGAAAITAAAYTPAMLKSGWEAFMDNPYVGRESATTLLAAAAYYARLLTDARSWGAGGIYVWGPLVIWGLAASARRGKALSLVTALSAIASSALLIWGLRPPARVFLFLAPLACVGVGAAFASLDKYFARFTRALRWAGGCAVLAAALAAVGVTEREGLIARADRVGAAPFARDAAAWLGTYCPEGGVVVANSPYNYALRYYLEERSSGKLSIYRDVMAVFTTTVFVVAPAGADLRQELTPAFGPGVTIHRQEFVGQVGTLGMWRVLVFK